MASLKQANIELSAFTVPYSFSKTLVSFFPDLQTPMRRMTKVPLLAWV